MSDNIPEQDRTKALPTQPTQPAADRTESVPAPTAASATTASATATSATAAPRGAGPYAAPEPEPVKGPYLAPVILGLVCLLVAAGALLVVLGALGLLSSRRRRR